VFIQPDNAIKTNRNGSKTWAIEEETLSPAPSSVKPDLQPNQRNRISGHYGINDRSSSLKNDLDAKLTCQNSTTYFPYRYGGPPPSRPLASGPNHFDNVERIDATPAGSNCTLQISGYRVSGAQAYALVIPGARRLN
jgi:hypothetical protein